MIWLTANFTDWQMGLYRNSLNEIIRRGCRLQTARAVAAGLAEMVVGWRHLRTISDKDLLRMPMVGKLALSEIRAAFPPVDTIH